MLDEFKSTEYIINELNNQVGFFKQNKDDALSLLQNISKLKMKYEMPYLIYLTRQSDNIYNKVNTNLTDSVAYTLNLYVKEVVGQEYFVNFLDVKGLIFTICKEDIEVVRFSLVNKNYTFMTSIIQNEDEYLKDKNNIERNIKSIENDILANAIRVELHKVAKNNYFKLFKHVKNVREFYSLLFKPKSVKEGLNKEILRLEGLDKALTDNKQSEEDRLNYLKDKYERSISTVNTLSIFFDKIAYKRDERHKFYV